MPLVSADVLDQRFDVCIAGAGPAGLACAFACHERGLRVLLLDAGPRRPVPGSPDLLAAEITHTKAHDPVEIVAAAALGGTSHWWGGRSVPLDPIDLREWPVSWEELLPWWRYAAELIGAGSILQSPPGATFAKLRQFNASGFETWAPEQMLAHRWRRRILARQGPAILLQARVTGMKRNGGRITSLDLLTPAGARTANAEHYVLTCGGLGGLRLLLMAQQADPSLFGGAGGPLGRGYMGHLSGSLADLVFTDPADADAFNFVDLGGRYMARRRIQPTSATIGQGGVNAAFWLDSPERGVASHGSAVASARFLAGCGVRLLAGELNGAQIPPLGPHFANVARSPLAGVAGVSHAAWTLAASRLTRQRYLPRRFLASGDGGWRLVYHAEQKRNPANRISLAATRDSVGLPKLNIDFRYSDADAAAVVRTHELLDQDLRQSGAGFLRWTCHDRPATVLDLAHDGYHQLGGAVMSSSSRTGIVDRFCRAHCLDNFWIVSGSVFPTGGQANPTLTIIALACRTADRIAAVRNSSAGSHPLELQTF